MNDDNSFLDLVPGGRLRVVVPVLASGGYKVDAATQGQGNALTLQAANLIGYNISHFALVGRADGRVRIRFVSGEASRNGKIAGSAAVPELPFPLPRKLAYVRLLYLTRSSQADHNMAIAATASREALHQFTDRMQHEPELCRSDAKVFCTWVPAGIAVRPD